MVLVSGSGFSKVCLWDWRLVRAYITSDVTHQRRTAFSNVGVVRVFLVNFGPRERVHTLQESQ